MFNIRSKLKIFFIDAPSIFLLPCSYACIVLRGISVRYASCACDNPIFFLFSLIILFNILYFFLFF